ncbi:MAG: tyrosine-type recombinase/integrase [Bdellovibrionales bacterium]
MKKKFNPKHYLGKDRIERSLSGNPGISKIWNWNPSAGEYQPPARGNQYVAYKTTIVELKKIRLKETFPTLEQARIWRVSNTKEEVLPARSTPKFSSVVERYRLNEMPRLRQSTQDSYNRMLGKYFEPLMSLQMSEITPNAIDHWIDYLKSLPRRKTRLCFRHEFNLLSGLVRFYCLHDDNYQSPIKERHRRVLVVQHQRKPKSQDLTEIEFQKFRQCLLENKNGLFFATLATVQFVQALRISEVTALKWDDIKWDHDPTKTRLRISRSYYFPRKKNAEPVLQDSFKNGGKNGGMKEAPLFQDAYQVLTAFKSNLLAPNGFIFHLDGKPLTYRMIQHAYDAAFEKAGLSFKGTHIMRHGGARRLYNKSNGDLSVVQQLLGNNDYKSALVYAKRSSSALNDVAELEWKKCGEVE